MHDSQLEKQLKILKEEIEVNLSKLEHVVPALNELVEKCQILMDNARQTLNYMEKQMSLTEKPVAEQSIESSRKEQNHVLIVEDESNIRELLKEFISSKGFVTRTAQDGREGILAVQQQKFDLVFLDLRLPGISGLEVLKRIKEINPQIPVVVVTGNAGDLQAVKERALRPQWVIPKPFKLQQINEALNMIGYR